MGMNRFIPDTKGPLWFGSIKCAAGRAAEKPRKQGSLASQLLVMLALDTLNQRYGMGILGFIFYKYLSDKLVVFATAEGFTVEDFSTLTEDDAETVHHFKSNLGYFIAHKHLFSTWLDQTSDFDVANVREALSAFSRLIHPNHKRLFDGIFKTLETMRGKRIVFIVDECHRSTFGDMLSNIKASFSGAVFFGFSGTPIHKENVRKDNTTTDVFGDELHRYSIADGIRDKNVLGFDPYQVLTYRDRDLRQAVALERAKAATVAEALADPAKNKVFNRYMKDVPMAGHRDAAGEYQRGIEDYLPNAQYERDEHRHAVLKDIADNWEVLSQAGKFHAIFATSSITEAITYYRLMKAQCPTLKITALFDPHISDDDTGGIDPAFKAAGLEEIIKDYNAAYGQKFDMGTHANFKRDLAARLAHKAPYIRVESEPEKRLDLLIVVNQMLTGFDSKWVNTLYCDKLLEYENIIQAFSRTNRLFGPDKPFGTIRYYRKPHTMKRNVDAAVKLYSGDKPIGLFADQLPRNLERLNDCFTEISAIFSAAGIVDFAKLPDDFAARAAFAKQFNQFSAILEAAKIQGFTWDKTVYEIDIEARQLIAVAITKLQYLTLLQRYKELGAGGGGAGESIPFDIDSHITEIDTGKIDADYMNSRFAKYLKELQSGDGPSKEATLAELHRSFPICRVVGYERAHDCPLLSTPRQWLIAPAASSRTRQFPTPRRMNFKG